MQMLRALELSIGYHNIENGVFQSNGGLTQRALDWRVRAAFLGSFLGSSQFR